MQKISRRPVGATRIMDTQYEILFSPVPDSLSRIYNPHHSRTRSIHGVQRTLVNSRTRPRDERKSDSSMSPVSTTHGEMEWIAEDVPQVSPLSSDSGRIQAEDPYSEPRSQSLAPQVSPGVQEPDWVSGGKQYPGSPTPPHMNETNRSIWPSPLTDWWLLEISATLLSFLSIIVIIVILATANGHPLSHWPLQITINTAISVFATLAKGMMLLAVAEAISQAKWNHFRTPHSLYDLQMVDAASRGPLGALRLLGDTIQTRRSGVYLIVLGSVITVAAILFEPFVQQVITYPSQPFLLDQLDASVGRSLSYNNEKASTDLPLQLAMAVNTGLSGLDSSSLLDVDCPTGNCTWVAPIPSLAVCSQCVNVTGSVSNKTSCAAYEVHIVDGNGDTAIQEQWFCAFDFPDFPPIQVTETGSFAGSTVMQTSPLVLAWGDGAIASNATFVFNSSSLSYLGVRNPILAFRQIQWGSAQDQYHALEEVGGMPLDGVAPNATECILHWCVQTWSLSVVNGHPNSTLLSTWYNESGISFYDSDRPPYWNNTSSDGMILAPNETNGFDSAPGSGSPPIFYVDKFSQWSLVWYLQTLFNASAYLDESDVLWYSSDVARLLWNAPDLPAAMARVAASMTNAHRSLADPPQDLVPGAVYATEPFVRVRWAWLALPILLVLAACALLLAEIHRTRRTGTAAWKSSSLPLVFNGLARVPPAAAAAEEEEGKGEATMERLGMMEARARRVRVRLERDGKMGRRGLRVQRK